MTNQTLKRVAVIGGSRIPFCRSNTKYADATNIEMLSATLQGLVEKYQLQGVKIDEVGAGAVITHSKDWNLARESVLNTGLSPLTPAYTLQQACGTSLQTALLSAGKIATGQIDCAIAAGTDTTSDAPIVYSRKIAQSLIKLSTAKTWKARMEALSNIRPKDLKPQSPSVNEPRTRKSMGQHCELMAQEWKIARKAQDELALSSHLKSAKAYDEGFFDDLIVPFSGVNRDNHLRADSSLEKLSTLKTVFDKSDAATLTAGNSTPLTDGAASVLLASEEWAKERGLPIQAYLTYHRTAAVDFVKGEGLLMAPTVAVAEMLQAANLTLQDFDFYEIHEAFAAQVLCTLKAWESKKYCKDRLGLDAPLGKIDMKKLNVKGSSLAVGHPFAATGARIIGTLGKILETAGSGRGLISVCTAGGMGVAAIMERP